MCLCALRLARVCMYVCKMNSFYNCLIMIMTHRECQAIFIKSALLNLVRWMYEVYPESIQAFNIKKILSLEQRCLSIQTITRIIYVMTTFGIATSSPVPLVPLKLFLLEYHGWFFHFFFFFKQSANSSFRIVISSFVALVLFKLFLSESHTRLFHF